MASWPSSPAAHHVVTYDVRGAGSSDVPADRAGYDLAQLSEDLAAVVDATSLEGPVHVVGHDWGSIQAWEAVCTGALGDRLATFTSMSGPSLDHVGHWFRARRHGEGGGRRELLGQGLRSWYVGLFQLPVVAPFGWRRFAERPFRRYLERVEGLGPDAQPGPSLPRDGANGVELYRQNVRKRMADPQERRTDVPVLLVVATGDRYVSTALLDDLASTARICAGSRSTPATGSRRPSPTSSPRSSPSTWLHTADRRLLAACSAAPVLRLWKLAVLG